MAGWGRAGWGDGPWGQPAVTLVDVTGVAGTSALGSETVVADAVAVASGNAATEDLVQLFESMNLTTGVDLDRAAQIGIFLEKLLGRPLPGRYYKFHQGKTRNKQQTA